MIRRRRSVPAVPNIVQRRGPATVEDPRAWSLSARQGRDDQSWDDNRRWPNAGGLPFLAARTVIVRR